MSASLSPLPYWTSSILFRNYLNSSGVIIAVLALLSFHRSPHLGTSQFVRTPIMSNITVASLHPYYPLGVVIPGYVAPSMSTLEILTKFTLTCLCILVPTGAYVYTRRRPVSRPNAIAALWFVLCGFIHLGLEGMHVSLVLPRFQAFVTDR